jgi:hypothetical protein
MARVGIIGTGWGARVQVPAFREAGLEVVAIAGHNADRTRRAAAELGLEAFDDWRSLIASNIDLVTIVTPPSEHLSMAAAALEAGKHVLSEKPMALDVAEAEPRCGMRAREGEIGAEAGIGGATRNKAAESGARSAPTSSTLCASSAWRSKGRRRVCKRSSTSVPSRMRTAA